MKLLFGTGNHAKLSVMRNRLERIGIELVGLNDLRADGMIIPEVLYEVLPRRTCGRVGREKVKMDRFDGNKEILKETELFPIDLHTSMWMWSRGKFISWICLRCR